MEPRTLTLSLPLLLLGLAGAAHTGRTEQPQSASQPRTRWLKVKRNTDGAPAAGKKSEFIN